MSISNGFRNPAVIVLVGRAAAQAGIFCFTAGPSLVLSDSSYNELLIGITVMLLAVSAPVGAFQQHLIRTSSIRESSTDALAKSVALAVGCSFLGFGVLLLLTPIGMWMVFLVVASIASVVPPLGASLHALGGGYVRSAAIDAVSGVLLVCATIILVIVEASLAQFMSVYMVVWCLAAVAAFVGPIRFPLSNVRIPTARLADIARESWPMIAIGIMAMAFNRADYLVLTIVGSDAEASRYALASRLIGPILIALGSLNNSLYVRQINARDDTEVMRAITGNAARKVGFLAIAVAPMIVGAVALVGRVSESIGDRDLVPTTVLLVVAAIPYAYAIPYGFALNAAGRERTWLTILSVATFGDLLAVLVVGRHGASVTAAVWVVVQVLVCVALMRAWKRLGDLPSTAVELRY